MTTVHLLMQGCAEHDAEHALIRGVFTTQEKALAAPPAGYWTEEWAVDDERLSEATGPERCPECDGLLYGAHMKKCKTGHPEGDS